MVKKSLLIKELYKPGEIAKMLNLTTRTIQNYCAQGMLEEIFTSTGRRLIPHESLVDYLIKHDLLEDDLDDLRYDAIYARVSTHKQKNRGDLDRQIDHLKVYVADKNPKNLKIYSDVASGLNDNRKQLMALMEDILANKVSRVFIAYKDRLTRFGFNYLKLICDYMDTGLVVVSSEDKDKAIEEELAEDIISIIHSFSGKLYGMRRKVKEELIKELS